MRGSLEWWYWFIEGSWGGEGSTRGSVCVWRGRRRLSQGGCPNMPLVRVSFVLDRGRGSGCGLSVGVVGVGAQGLAVGGCGSVMGMGVADWAVGAGVFRLAQVWAYRRRANRRPVRDARGRFARRVR